MIEELIARYLRGEATPEEQLQVRKWIEEEGEGWLERFIEAHWGMEGPVRLAGERRRLKKKMLAAIKAQDRLRVVPMYRKDRRLLIGVSSAAAACVITAIALWLLRPM